MTTLIKSQKQKSSELKMGNKKIKIRGHKKSGIEYFFFFNGINDIFLLSFT